MGLAGDQKQFNEASALFTASNLAYDEPDGTNPADFDPLKVVCPDCEVVPT
jgi:hypothetical protein